MKETLKDILHNDIITKTKATFHDLVSGVKNLFRHNDANEQNQTAGQNLNTPFKSQDEIDADFRFFSASEAEENVQVKKPETTFLEVSESYFKMNVINEKFPEQMEENY